MWCLAENAETSRLLGLPSPLDAANLKKAAQEINDAIAGIRRSQCGGRTWRVLRLEQMVEVRKMCDEAEPCPRRYGPFLPRMTCSSTTSGWSSESTTSFVCIERESDRDP